MEFDRNSLEVLSRAECIRLMTDSQIGRVVVTQNALPAAFPVNFVVLDGDVAFATRAGSKLEAAMTGQVVAFEVDEIDPVSQTGWSVLVQGRASVVDDAVELARVRSLPLVPWTGGSGFRLVRVRTEIISGRRLLPSHPAEPPVEPGCPRCGSMDLLRVTLRPHNFVCANCAACWRLDEGRARRMDPLLCAGCSFKPMCTAAFARDRFLAGPSPVAHQPHGPS